MAGHRAASTSSCPGTGRPRKPAECQAVRERVPRPRFRYISTVRKRHETGIADDLLGPVDIHGSPGGPAVIRAPLWRVGTMLERSRLVVSDAVWEKVARSEEHTSELQSRQYLVCRLLLEKNSTACSCPNSLT